MERRLGQEASSCLCQKGDLHLCYSFVGVKLSHPTPLALMMVGCRAF